MLNQTTIWNAGTTTINNLILQNLPRLQMTSDEFLLYLNLRMFQELGVRFPATEQLEQNTGFTADQIYQLLQSLIQKKLIRIESQNQQGQKYQDCYDLSPTLKRLMDHDQASDPNPLNNDLQTLFQKIEVEFGRTLSPLERETIQAWLVEDHYPVELITLALKEAVLNQVYSLKYMDRILLNWEKQHIQTAQQLQKYRERTGGY
ncbi:DnaD domain protein [Lactobacillus sp. DCY120]|uniref:DnaD domain protein n=1 Tax=Bombilactobacillus apium TaxID=2675299 RepID=A0A850R4P7_9LACO|nr:DnaD domain protein [Bombilactobacillus apium]NVY95817.1 DnaD domain protein [Bombilactobacillus apium]